MTKNTHTYTEESEKKIFLIYLFSCSTSQISLFVHTQYLAKFSTVKLKTVSKQQ